MTSMFVQRVCIACTFTLAPILASAAESSDDVGREALRSLGKVSWYEPDEDDVRAMKVKSTDGASSDSENRSGGAVRPVRAKPAAPVAAKPASSFWGDLGSALGWALLILLIAGLCVVLFYAISNQERRRALGSSLDGDEEEDGETAERLERLPVQVRQPSSNLLGEARRLMEEGKYNEAIVYLFSHQLVQLDRHQFLRFGTR